MEKSNTSIAFCFLLILLHFNSFARSSITKDTVKRKGEDSSSRALINEVLPKIFIPDLNEPKAKHLYNPNNHLYNHNLQIIQEKQGFIWIISNNRLYRYDGLFLKEFDMGSGRENYTEVAFISRNNTVWVGQTYTSTISNRVDLTTWGACINQFDKITEKFRPYFIPLEKANKNFTDTKSDRYPFGFVQMKAIMEDRSGNILIVMNIGIYLFNLKTQEFTYLSLPPTTNNQNPLLIHFFEKGNSNDMWLGTSKGLYHYHAHRFTHYQHNPTDPNSLDHDFITGLHKDSAGTLWVLTENGLNKFIPAKNNFKRLSLNGRLQDIVGWNHVTDKAILLLYKKELYHNYPGAIPMAPRFGVSFLVNDIVKPSRDFIQKQILTWLSFPSLIIIVLSFAFYRYRIRQVRRQEQLKTSFEKQLAEVSITALRAQMNPHFLFNSLNSINNFIVKNKAEDAANYLTKFSRLIRLILTNSKLALVSLANELEAIRLYIQLENIRFNGRFSYSLEIQEGVDIEYFEIPPLLIQPYVENAIWHGLLHKEGKGHLKIKVYVQNAYLYVEVEDNGVGRKLAVELKSKSATKDKSMGMQITSERVEMLNKLKQQQATVEIIDQEDSNGNPLGTKVILKIPL
ncbi:hypothetical protein AHMF7605_28810 [Adhaeribacter arboris]|uniref:Signal transduction histidine kinase internal region domain-containing protein n=1 Tax=Adhaeribacter arboris TaxID=2072846 RepID=A0A2T2Y8T7_9BACT|nr:histidine kinase [Adhaeribacter arboris]PSR51913.1 hypothetical protein AHMF7605_28810 [Adhaeribacter arboris]